MRFPSLILWRTKKLPGRIVGNFRRYSGGISYNVYRLDERREILANDYFLEYYFTIRKYELIFWYKIFGGDYWDNYYKVSFSSYLNLINLIALRKVYITKPVYFGYGGMINVYRIKAIDDVLEKSGVAPKATVEDSGVALGIPIVLGIEAFPTRRVRLNWELGGGIFLIAPTGFENYFYKFNLFGLSYNW